MNMDLNKNNREQWKSRSGFILAAIGSAVGLGNIWGFSYNLGQSGGAAFLLIYIICIILIGYPIMMAEFTIGRYSQSDAVGSFQKIAPGKPWVIGGFMGVFAAFFIMSFYPVIAGWVTRYFGVYLTGGFETSAENDFIGFISGTTGPLIWHFIFVALTTAIVFFGVQKGIEKSNKVLMPLLALFLLVLAIYSLTLGGATEGLRFMFSPTWDSLTNPSVYLAALGQAFFSLSLGMGALITYASYLKKENKLPGAAASIVGFDTLLAIVSGIMIFPAVFSFNIDPAGGTGLVFMTLPNVFIEMGRVGVIFGFLFFLLLGVAALSSAISLLEVPVSYIMRRLNWSRRLTVIVVGLAIYIIGVPVALSIGPLSHITIFNLGLMDLAEYVSFNLLLPLGGLIISLFVGWGWNKSAVLRESDFGQSVVGTIWIWLLRVVSPFIIVLIFLSSIGIIGS
ncbi:UNVERIFIED_CONTAM: NSS family neurotransmitter:Na+ symporter [Acetivibrio alkalicellulosi]